jgi:hypothetical protein
MKKRRTLSSAHRPATNKRRLSLAGLQARVCQLESALATIGELHAKLHKRMIDDQQTLLVALKDAVKIIDEERAGKKSSYTLQDVKRLEAIRLLSLGV